MRHSALIIYHDNCPDGFGAAWWLGKAIPSHIKFGASYNDTELPDVDDKYVYVVDFCYPHQLMIELCQRAFKVVVLDHHETATKYLTEPIPYLSVVPTIDVLKERLMDRLDTDHMAVLNMNRSGVGLVSEYVNTLLTGVKAPWFMANIEDRDLWRFRLDETRAVFAYITSLPFTEENFDTYAKMEPSSVILAGEAIERYRQNLIDTIIETKFLVTIDGHEVWCCAAPYAVGSDVAGKMAEDDPSRPFACYFVAYEDHLKLGLRVRGDSDFNVATLAARFDGGGHPKASGMKLNRNLPGIVSAYIYPWHKNWRINEATS